MTLKVTMVAFELAATVDEAIAIQQAVPSKIPPLAVLGL
jgi:hypothetical protein